MTTKGGLRDLTASILMGGTAAGAQVFTPRDWATWEGEYPAILVRAPREEKESLGRGTFEFNVVATIQIVAKVEAPAASDDYGGEAAEMALEALELQILALIINNPALTQATPGVGRIVQQFPSITSKIDITAKGESHLGELVLEIGMEFYQGPEDFYPDNSLPLREVAVHLDALNVFDPTATFADPPFPQSVTPAPRTSGPDGRDEAALLIDLSQ